MLLMYRSFRLTSDSCVSIDKLNFILVINIVILEEIIVSLDIAQFSRVRWTNKGSILREKSIKLSSVANI